MHTHTHTRTHSHALTKRAAPFPCCDSFPAHAVLGAAMLEKLAEEDDEMDALARKAVEEWHKKRNDPKLRQAMLDAEDQVNAQFLGASFALFACSRSLYLITLSTRPVDSRERERDAHTRAHARTHVCTYTLTHTHMHTHTHTRTHTHAHALSSPPSSVAQRYRWRNRRHERQPSLR